MPEVELTEEAYQKLMAFCAKTGGDPSNALSAFVMLKVQKIELRREA